MAKDEEFAADTQDAIMVETGKVRRNYRLNRRLLYKMKKLLETNCWDSETELIESAVDLLYEMLLKNQLPEGFEITLKEAGEDKDKEKK
jgi:hypothetical protein